MAWLQQELTTPLAGDCDTAQSLTLSAMTSMVFSVIRDDDTLQRFEHPRDLACRALI